MREYQIACDKTAFEVPGGVVIQSNEGMVFVPFDTVITEWLIIMERDYQLSLPLPASIQPK